MHFDGQSYHKYNSSSSSSSSSRSLVKAESEELDSEGCSDSILLSFMILGHLFFFSGTFYRVLKVFFARTFYRVYFIESKSFFAIRLPAGFRCQILLPRFLPLIFVLSITSKSIWRRWLVSWFNVNTALTLVIRKIGEFSFLIIYK